MRRVSVLSILLVVQLKLAIGLRFIVHLIHQTEQPITRY